MTRLATPRRYLSRGNFKDDRRRPLIGTQTGQPERERIDIARFFPETAGPVRALSPMAGKDRHSI
jgi:hypothetical protein